MNFLKTLVYLAFISTPLFSSSIEPIVTAKKYIAYKRDAGIFDAFSPPEVVLVCYQQSTLNYFLGGECNLTPTDAFSDLYFVDDGRVAILGGWGFGAPALANKMEQLIELGTRQFVAVGTAGTLLGKHSIGEYILSHKALAEDGVAHLYLKDTLVAEADTGMVAQWRAFAKNHDLPEFQSANAWSFSSIFRETPSDVCRVTQLGFDVVEMEAATLYAIGQEKCVQTLSLFVISDSITEEEWVPHIKEPIVRNRLHSLADWGLEFCKTLLVEDPLGEPARRF